MPVIDGLRFVGPIIGVSLPKKPAIVLAGLAIPVSVLATSPNVLVNPLAKFEKKPWLRWRDFRRIKSMQR